MNPPNPPSGYATDDDDDDEDDDDSIQTERQRDRPEYMRVPMESAQTCPVRSTSIQELIAVTRGFWLIT